MDAAVLSVLTGSGVAGVFCTLFILGLIYPKSVLEDKDKVIAEKDKQIDALTAQVAQAGHALNAAKDVIASLQQGLILAGRMPLPPPPPALPGSGSTDG